MLISLIRFLENLNISRTLSLLMSLINGSIRLDMVLETYSILFHYILRCCFYNANTPALVNELNVIYSCFSTLNENNLLI